MEKDSIFREIIGLEVRVQSGNEMDNMETPEAGIHSWFEKTSLKGKKGFSSC